MTKSEAISRTLPQARATGRSWFVVWCRGCWHDRVSLEEVNHGVFKDVRSQDIIEVTKHGTVIGHAQ